MKGGKAKPTNMGQMMGMPPAPQSGGLEDYTRDLTALAREGKIEPVIGRDAEIARMIQILSRKTKNNPVLVGDAGVGKLRLLWVLLNVLPQVMSLSAWLRCGFWNLT